MARWIPFCSPVLWYFQTPHIVALPSLKVEIEKSPKSATTYRQHRPCKVPSGFRFASTSNRLKPAKLIIGDYLDVFAISRRDYRSCDMHHGQAHLHHPIRVILDRLRNATDHNISVADGFHFESSIIVGLIVKLNVQPTKWCIEKNRKRQNLNPYLFSKRIISIGLSELHMAVKLTMSE